MSRFIAPIALLFVCLVTLSAGSTLAADGAVTFLRVPDGGIQQQTVVDSQGVVHMVYLKGDPKNCDLFYVKLAAGETAFSQPIRVNSQAGSAVALGTIRGPQLAVGQNGRVHVVWNGNSQSQPRGPLNPAMDKTSPYNGTPFLYARLNDAGTGFENQRNLMQNSFALDGGGAIAADDAGNVYAVWHGLTGTAQGEVDRRVFAAVSKDGGKTFAAETAIDPNKLGACACCGMKAFIDAKGVLMVMFRTAKGGVDRDMDLLISRDKGRSFQQLNLDRWNVGACVMSSAAMVSAGEEAACAWETKEQVFFATVDPKTNRVGAKIAAPGLAAKRKHPALARAKNGDLLLVWAEGTGWQKGGSVAWQRFDKDGKPAAGDGMSGSKSGIPTWGLASAAARPDGSFVVIY